MKPHVKRSLALAGILALVAWVGTRILDVGRDSAAGVAEEPRAERPSADGGLLAPEVESEPRAAIAPRGVAEVPVSISGTVVLVGHPDGARLSGTIRAALIDGGVVSPPLGMPVREGAWSIQAAWGAELALYRGELGGAPCWPVRARLELRADGPLVIEMASEPFVRVLDSSTRLEVGHAFVLPRTGPESEGAVLPHVGRFGEIPLPAALETPIRIGLLPGAASCWITADGYTWGVACLGRAPASQVVALDPAGSLRLSIRGGKERLTSTCAVRVLPASGEAEGRAQPLYAIPIREVRAEYLLAKLRAGRQRVEIVRDAGAANESVLFRAQIELTPGAETVVAVDLVDEDSAVAPTPVSFLVVGEPEALTQVDAISIAPERVRTARLGGRTWLRAGEIVASRPDVLEYRPVPLAPGTYRVDLRPLGFVERVVIPEDTLHVQEIALPRVRDYALTVRSSSGELVRLESVQVASSGMEDSELHRLPPLGRSIHGGANPIAFSAVAGNLKVSLSATGFQSRQVVLDGVREHAFQLILEDACELRLRLTHGGETLHAPLAWWTTVRLLSQAETVTRCLLEFDATATPGWLSEAILRPESRGAFVLTAQRLLGQPGSMRIPFDVRPGRSILVLDAASEVLIE